MNPHKAFVVGYLNWCIKNHSGIYSKEIFLSRYKKYTNNFFGSKILYTLDEYGIVEKSKISYRNGTHIPNVEILFRRLDDEVTKNRIRELYG